MDDSQIIKALFDRAESAIAALVERFGPPLSRMLKNILGNDQEAEECVNDTYLALWNTIPPTRPEHLGAYVYRTGRNLALKRIRADSTQKRNSARDVSLDELAECLPDLGAEQELEARELGRAIDRFLSEQSKENRIIFVRRYWFGDSVKTIASELNRSVSSVSVRLFRTREGLKTYLTREGFYDEA